MKLTDNQTSAFWSKVDITEANKCWEWQAAKNSKGYGNVRINNVYYHAHRVAWILTNFTPPPGYTVMHICDNPSCCNPSHLVLGTTQANNCDKLIKNRGKGPANPKAGEENHNSKLTSADVAMIRKLYPEKNQYQLAEQFNVTQSTIGAIVRRKTWRHVA